MILGKHLLLKQAGNKQPPKPRSQPPVQHQKEKKLWFFVVAEVLVPCFRKSVLTLNLAWAAIKQPLEVNYARPLRIKRQDEDEGL
jgi:hypothetical protein